MPEVLHRHPRLRPPAPVAAIDLPALPVVEPPVKLQPVQLLVPVLGSLSILVYGVMARTPVLLVTGGIMALASLASPVVLHWTARRAQRAKIEGRRARYRARLGELSSTVERAKSELAVVLADPHPRPESYDAWLASGRLWERRRDDQDLLDVRLGTATLPTGFLVTRPQSSPGMDPDTELVDEADGLEHAAGSLDAAPLVLRLTEDAVVAVRGPREAAVRLVRALVLELALTCAPDDLSLLAAFPPGEVPTWDWLKWLPHTASPGTGGPSGPSERLLATTAQALDDLLETVVAPRLRLLEEGARPGRQAFERAVLVVDRYDPLSELGLSAQLSLALARAVEIGVTVLAICDADTSPPSETTSILTVAGPDDASGGGGALRRLVPAAEPIAFAPLGVERHEAERVARILAPKRLVADAMRSGSGAGRRLIELLPGHVHPPSTSTRADVGEFAWRPLAPSRLLRVPLGVTADGSPLEVDLKEPADGGHGPHGLVVGAVGSGKSELLRTLVCALAATHGPYDVEFAFADFKGGLTFSLLQELPHCSGMITNLADDLSLVDRMKAALVGELERRQQCLRAAGTDIQKIGQYRAVREERPELPPLPFLVVVVDEFGELLEARPDMLDVLLSIGRTGRSLGVHLVLASQRPETGRSRGLDSYLGYRICLRTYTPEDSLTVLGSRAAADLPPLPGHGYLRAGPALIRFTAATVSDPQGETFVRPVRRFVTGGVRARGAAGTPATTERSEGRPSSSATEQTDVAALVRAVRGSAPGRTPVPLWLPPLPRSDEPGRLTLADDRLRPPTGPRTRGLPVPVGLVDLPRARRQVPIVLDPAALDGHLLVVGGPQTGKSSALAAYATHAAQLHPAAVLQFHVIDLGGGGLAPLEELPNVGAYADGHDPEAVHRILQELERLLDDQPRQLRRHGVRSIPAWHELVARGEAPGPAHTVLLLDQLVSFRERFADVDVTFGRLLVEGPGAGVHVALSSSRWAELPAKRLEQISTRIELRLNDPMESQHGRVAAASVPVGLPGRGLTRDGVVLQLAAPGEPGAPGDLSAAVRAAAVRAGERWPGVTAPPLRRLADLTSAEWAGARGEAVRTGTLLLGVGGPPVAPVTVDPAQGLAVLSYGDAASGRTRFLSRLLTEASLLPEGSRPLVYVLDYLGAVLDTCGDSPMIVAAGYGPPDTADVLAALTEELIRRQSALAGARRDGVPPCPFSPLWLVADDYELVHASARPGLVAELANLVPYAARLGFGLVVNQAANGSGARVDPLVRRLLEAGAWHLRFAVESRLELLLTGTRGSPLPPGQAVLTRPGRPAARLAVLPPDVAIVTHEQGQRAEIRLVS